MPDFELFHTGDMHLGGFRYAFEYMQRTITCLTEMLAAIRERAAGVRFLVVVIAGDFWDTKGILQHERKAGWWFLTNVLKIANVRILMINGNHDYYDHQGTTMLQDFSEATRVLKRLHVVTTTPGIVEMELGAAKVGFLCVPCQQHLTTETMAGLITGLRKRTESQYTYAVIHECFLGTSNETGYAYKSKLELASDSRISGYLLGDIHMRQTLGARAWYCGSPWQTRFMEDPKKGVLIWHQDVAEPEVLELRGIPKLVETSNIARVTKLANTVHSVRYTGLTPLGFQAPNVTHAPRIASATQAGAESLTVAEARDIDSLRAITNEDLLGGLPDFLATKGKLDSDDCRFGLELAAKELAS